MNENAERKNGGAVQWLRLMLYTGMVSLLNSIVTMIPVIPGALTTWLSRGITLAAILWLWQMSQVNPRYRKAAVYRLIMFACAIAAVFLHGTSILTLAASIFSIMAVYQEYNAHADLIRGQDQKLADRWCSLFYWGFAAGILISLGTVFSAVLVALTGMDIQKTVSWIVLVLMLPDTVVSVIYLCYLQKTIRVLQPGEGEHDGC